MLFLAGWFQLACWLAGWLAGRLACYNSGWLAAVVAWLATQLGFEQLAGWLAAGWDWSSGWLIGSLAGWLAAFLTG